MTLPASKIADISIGSAPNDGTGTPIRSGMDWIKQDAAALWSELSAPECRLAFHSVTATPSTIKPVTNAELSTTTDPAGLWDTVNDRIVVPSGITGVRITFYAASNFGATEDGLLVVSKNGAPSVSAGTPGSEATIWKTIIPSSVLTPGGVVGASLVIDDPVSLADYYEFGVYKIGAGNLDFHGDIRAEMIL